MPELLWAILVAVFAGMIWMTPWAVVMTVITVRHGRRMEAQYGVTFGDYLRKVCPWEIAVAWAIGLTGIVGTAILLPLALGGA